MTSVDVRIGQSSITVLKYADDLVIFSKSTEGLQNGLRTLHHYCCINKLTVNTDNSQLLLKKILNG